MGQRTYMRSSNGRFAGSKAGNTHATVGRAGGFNSASLRAKAGAGRATAARSRAVRTAHKGAALRTVKKAAGSSVGVASAALIGAKIAQVGTSYAISNIGRTNARGSRLGLGAGAGSARKRRNGVYDITAGGANRSRGSFKGKSRTSINMLTAVVNNMKNADTVLSGGRI